MVSFGHAAFFGVGAYTSALLVEGLGVPVFLAMLAGGAAGGGASVMTMPALRLRGPYFALAILAYAHIFRILANQMTGVTGGAGGILSIPPLPTVLGFDFSSKLGAYLVILTLLVLGVLAYKAIRDSYCGLALQAMHDSEDATRVVGVQQHAAQGGDAGRLRLHGRRGRGLQRPLHRLPGARLRLQRDLVGDPDRRRDLRRLPHAVRPDHRRAGDLSAGPAAVQGPDAAGHQIMLGALLGAMILFSPPACCRC